MSLLSPRRTQVTEQTNRILKNIFVIYYEHNHLNGIFLRMKCKYHGYFIIYLFVVNSLSQQATEALQRSHISKQSTGCELRNNIFGINACPIYSICPFPNGVFTYSNIRPDVEDFFCPFSSNSKLRLYTLFIQ